MLRGNTSSPIMKSRCLLLAFVGVVLGLNCPLLAKSAQLSRLITERPCLPVPRGTINVQSHEIGTRRLVTNQQGLLQSEESQGWRGL